MLLQKDDGTYLCGPLDIVCILHNVETVEEVAAVAAGVPKGKKE